MNIILLQGQLTLQEIDQLLKEFPQYLFLSLSEAAYKNLSPDHWARMEILYGFRLAKEELEIANQLRWIHCPGPYLNRLCMEDIEKQGTILVTNTIDENIHQMGEFVMGGVLAFAKNLFQWKEANQFPNLVWNSKWRDTMWTLKNKTFLQVGLGKGGTEIARRAHGFEMKVWGTDPHFSFHPYCQKIFPIQELHAVLPQADIVCLSLPKGRGYQRWFQMEELELMKEDSILISLGSSTIIDEEALVKTVQTGKFRGVLLDAFYQIPIPITSPLWKLPNVIITPDIAQRPKSTERQAFRLFLYNLRQYVHGNFKDMRNVVDKTYSIIQ